VDGEALGALAARLGAGADQASLIAAANTTALAFDLAGDLPLAATIAAEAHRVAQAVLEDAPVALEVLLIDREGRVVAHHA
jgi:cobalt-precorrin-5B (C1)-methyltransferase